MADDDRVVRWQERITPMHRRLAGGCHLDRLIGDRIGSSGFEVVECDEFYGEGPKVTSYLSLGWARRV